MTDGIAPVPEDDGILAAEYVLHLLAPPESSEVEERIARDPDFADEVRRWQEDLAVLAMELDEVPPSPAGKAALMARLFDERRRRDLGRAEGLVRRLRWALATGVVAAVVLAVLLFYPLREPGPGPSHVAELQPAQREFVLTAALILGDTPRLELTRINGPVAPSGRATELWAIPPGGAPVSLGVLPATANWIVNLPPELAARAPAVTLALSDEPEGGSPTGAPSGEVLAASPFSGL